MPRKHRVHFPGAFYHAINRGNGRQAIFLDPKDYRAFLRHLKTTFERFPAVLHAYCLMPNHFHLLLEVDKTPLSVLMRSLLTQYAKYFNRTHRKVGHVFQGRYRAILCQKDSYLLELTRYIHLNPLRARLVSRPEIWRWSSHRPYLGLEKDALLHLGDVLAYFNGNRKAFARFVLEARDLPSQKHFYPPESFPHLGDKAFLESIPHPKEPRRRLPSQLLTRMTVEKLAERLCRRAGTAVGLLSARIRPRSLSRLREQLIYAAIRFAEIPPSRVARYLRVSPPAVTQAFRRFHIKVLHDFSLEKRLFASLSVN